MGKRQVAFVRNRRLVTIKISAFNAYAKIDVPYILPLNELDSSAIMYLTKLRAPDNSGISCVR